MIKIKKLNKHADTKLLSIWWFAVLTVIAGGVIIGVTIFQSAKVDVRVLESDILSAKIINCVLDKGYFNSEFVVGKMDIFSVCGLNKELLTTKGNYYIKFQLNDIAGKEIFPLMKYGNNALEGDCLIQQSLISARNFARCSQESVSGLDSNGRKLVLSIMTASNKDFRLETTR